jgi:hypothetical protein
LGGARGVLLAFLGLGAGGFFQGFGGLLQGLGDFLEGLAGRRVLFAAVAQRFGRLGELLGLLRLGALGALERLPELVPIERLAVRAVLRLAAGGGRLFSGFALRLGVAGFARGAGLVEGFAGALELLGQGFASLAQKSVRAQFVVVGTRRLVALGLSCRAFAAGRLAQGLGLGAQGFGALGVGAFAALHRGGFVRALLQGFGGLLGALAVGFAAEDLGGVGAGGGGTFQPFAGGGGGVLGLLDGGRGVLQLGGGALQTLGATVGARGAVQGFAQGLQGGALARVAAGQHGGVDLLLLRDPLQLALQHRQAHVAAAARGVAGLLGELRLALFEVLEPLLERLLLGALGGFAQGLELGLHLALAVGQLADALTRLAQGLELLFDAFGLLGVQQDLQERFELADDLVLLLDGLDHLALGERVARALHPLRQGARVGQAFAQPLEAGAQQVGGARATFLLGARQEQLHGALQALQLAQDQLLLLAQIDQRLVLLGEGRGRADRRQRRGDEAQRGQAEGRQRQRAERGEGLTCLGHNAWSVR